MFTASTLWPAQLAHQWTRAHRAGPLQHRGPCLARRAAADRRRAVAAGGGDGSTSASVNGRLTSRRVVQPTPGGWPLAVGRRCLRRHTQCASGDPDVPGAAAPPAPVAPEAQGGAAAAAAPAAAAGATGALPGAAAAVQGGLTVTLEDLALEAARDDLAAQWAALRRVALGDLGDAPGGGASLARRLAHLAGGGFLQSSRLGELAAEQEQREAGGASAGAAAAAAAAVAEANGAGPAAAAAPAPNGAWPAPAVVGPAAEADVAAAAAGAARGVEDAQPVAGPGAAPGSARAQPPWVAEQEPQLDSGSGSSSKSSSSTGSEAVDPAPATAGPQWEEDDGPGPAHAPVEVVPVTSMAALATLAVAAVQWWPVLPEFWWGLTHGHAGSALWQAATTFPDTPVTRAMQMDFAAVIDGGEWRRLLTAGFVHSGVLPALWCADGLRNAGSWVELLCGGLQAFIILALSAAGAAAAQLVVGPAETGLAGSGTVTGLYVAWALLGLTRGRALGMPVTSDRGVLYLLLNLLLAARQPAVGLPSIAGGALGGTLGALLAAPLARAAAVLVAVPAAVALVLVRAAVEAARLVLGATLVVVVATLRAAGELVRTVRGL